MAVVCNMAELTTLKVKKEYRFMREYGYEFARMPK